jgi:uncharacterized protein (DUF1778 family)
MLNLRSAILDDQPPSKTNVPPLDTLIAECTLSMRTQAILSPMPRTAVEGNSRMSLRIRPEEKALLLRAVALNHTDLTDFVVRHALDAAKRVIDAADHLQLSQRDSLRVLDALENPPQPNGKLLAAARALRRSGSGRRPAVSPGVVRSRRCRPGH